MLRSPIFCAGWFNDILSYSTGSVQLIMSKQSLSFYIVRKKRPTVSKRCLSSWTSWRFAVDWCLFSISRKGKLWILQLKLFSKCIGKLYIFKFFNQSLWWHASHMCNVFFLSALEKVLWSFHSEFSNNFSTNIVLLLSKAWHLWMTYSIFTWGLINRIYNIADEMTDRQTDRQETDRQTGRHADRQTDIQTDRQT